MTRYGYLICYKLRYHQQLANHGIYYVTIFNLGYYYGIYYVTNRWQCCQLRYQITNAQVIVATQLL